MFGGLGKVPLAPEPSRCQSPVSCPAMPERSTGGRSGSMAMSERVRPIASTVRRSVDSNTSLRCVRPVAIPHSTTDSRRYQESEDRHDDVEHQFTHSSLPVRAWRYVDQHLLPGALRGTIGPPEEPALASSGLSRTARPQARPSSADRSSDRFEGDPIAAHEPDLGVLCVGVHAQPPRP